MGEQLGWGILGAGNIAAVFAKDLQLDGMHMAAVASRDGERALAFADAHGIPTAHADYESLASDPNVDVVYVATPHSFHLEHAGMMIDGGKHVLVEKAFTTTGDEAEALVDAARTKGVFAMEAMWTRFLPTMVAVRERVSAGLLGHIEAVVSDHSQVLNLSPGSRLIEPSLGGGALLDLGVYNFALAHEFLGAASRIHATGIVDDNGVDHRSSVIALHDSGGISTSTFSMRNLGSNRASIIGGEGVTELDERFYDWTSFTRREHGSNAVVETYEPEIHGRGMQFEAREVERAIEGGQLESPLMTLDESVAIMRLMDAIRAQLAETGARL